MARDEAQRSRRNPNYVFNPLPREIVERLTTICMLHPLNFTSMLTNCCLQSSDKEGGHNAQHPPAGTIWQSMR